MMLSMDHFGTFIQILRDLGILCGLYLAYRRIVAAENNVNIAQEGQVTDRFTRAIDQLGQDGDSVGRGNEGPPSP